MKREIVTPSNRDHWLELRSKNLNSTDISALFGCSPYSTEFELWHKVKDRTLTNFQENERTKWGTRLQDSIADGLAEEYGWEIRDYKEYESLPDHRIGSSFDFEIMPNGQGISAILEIKNVDALQFKEKWLIDGDDTEAPLHIELQVQHQMLVSGLKTAYIGALIGGNRVMLIRREFDQSVADAILKKSKEFWKSQDENLPPKPNFSVDADFISKLYQFAEVGKTIEADDKVSDLLEKYRAASREMKIQEDLKDAAKAEILTLIGPAEKVIHRLGSLSCGMIAGGPVAYDRKPYRNFKPYWRKTKEVEE